jgi:hypothetical protein
LPVWRLTVIPITGRESTYINDGLSSLLLCNNGKTKQDERMGRLPGGEPDPSSIRGLSSLLMSLRPGVSRRPFLTDSLLLATSLFGDEKAGFVAILLSR